MGDISRDSFKETQNILNDLRGLTTSPQENPRHYVTLRLQQGVPVVDADWNEMEDIRRMELELLLARFIGSGVPAGSDGFRISEAGIENDFLIETGLLFLNGWLVYNAAAVQYSTQPHRDRNGVVPALPIPLSPVAVATRELVFLDTWEQEVDSEEDDNLVDQRIGAETAIRLERLWVVRMEPIDDTADPLDPGTIPNQQPGHRYYPLATTNRPPGGQITDPMITDLRRTHLTLDALTHAPLFIYNPTLDQRLDSARLGAAFRGNLDVLHGLFLLTPEVFVFTGHETETWQSMTAYQDVRAAASAFEKQATAEILHRTVAFQAMNSFFQAQIRFRDILQDFVDDGIASAATEDFLDIYNHHLVGNIPNDPSSLEFALAANDLLGAVMAQERLNEELGLQTNMLPEGTVTANLISVTPLGPVVANTTYQLTIRIQSHLTSVQGSERIRAIVSAGPGWNLQFQGAIPPNLREIVVEVTNQESRDVVLFITAAAGAANTELHLSVRPERRQQLLYNHPPVVLAIGQEILPGGSVIATLNYQGPPLPPGNIAQVPRNVMFGGVSLPFGVTNLSTEEEEYQLTVTAQGDSNPLGWQPPNQPVLPPLAPNGGTQNVNITFQTTDETNAVSPVTYRMQLVRLTGGVNEPLAYTIFDLTFELI